MTALPQTSDRLSPRQQAHWDWRAACNFIAGGTGGSLLLWATLDLLHGGDARPLIGAGLALIAFGLGCVWLEIGRPWRALNTFRHFSSSWMTREASVAALLFVSGFLALWSGQNVLIGTTGLLGLAFLYAQARILAADKGIPAWRHPRCLQLMVLTGLTEGLSLMVCAGWLYPQPLPADYLLALFAGLRLIAWRRYLSALVKDGAPAGSIKALKKIDAEFFWVGSAIPAMFALLAGMTGSLAPAIVAGALAAVMGWRFKYTLICRAAFTQGFTLPKRPVRWSAIGPTRESGSRRSIG